MLVILKLKTNPLLIDAETYKDIHQACVEQVKTGVLLLDRNIELLDVVHEPCELEEVKVCVASDDDEAADGDSVPLCNELQSLLKRFRHLLESDFIRSFDEYDRKTGTYVRDISEADNIIKDYERLRTAVEKFDNKYMRIKYDPTVLPNKF